MNAGGYYESLTGEYFKAQWEPKSEAEWCNEGGTTCACGGHHTSAQHDSHGNVTCSGGAKQCSHGYYKNHIVKWKYWLELTEMTPDESQPLAKVYVGVRWYEYTSYSFKVELPEKPKELIRLTIPMNGEVWIDDVPDKKMPDLVEGKRDDQEKGYKNAEVYIYKVLRNSTGKIISRELQKYMQKTI